MSRSNTANGGTSYVDLVIQVVSTSNDAYVLRAVVYLTSLNVVDSTNSLNVGGNWGRSGALGLNGVYNSTPVWYQDITVNRVVGSTVTATVTMSWSSVEYWGVTLTASESYTLPAKATAPGAPSVRGQSALSSSAIRLQWNPPDDHGAAVDQYGLHVWTAGHSFTSADIYNGNLTGTERDITGLQRNTAYFWGVDAHNAYGWGDKLFAGPVTTLATAPDAPAMPSVGMLAPDGAPISWSAPNNGGSAITGYDVQIATNSGFTAGVVTFTNVTSPYSLTGLLPATQYWVRVRAKNAVGTGAWSAANLFTTLSGVKVKVAGTWRNAKLWVKVGGAWVLAPKVWKKHDDVWSI